MHKPFVLYFDINSCSLKSLLHLVMTLPPRCQSDWTPKQKKWIISTRKSRHWISRKQWNHGFKFVRVSLAPPLIIVTAHPHLSSHVKMDPTTLSGFPMPNRMVILCTTPPSAFSWPHLTGLLTICVLASCTKASPSKLGHNAPDTMITSLVQSQAFIIYDMTTYLPLKSWASFHKALQTCPSHLNGSLGMHPIHWCHSYTNCLRY